MSRPVDLRQSRLAGEMHRGVTTRLEDSELKVPGARLAAASAGICQPARDDVALIELAQGSRCAAAFTQNALPAAPVIIGRRHLAARAPRYILVNAGVANAATGDPGLAHALACCDAVAATAGCDREEVVPVSTGVIGQPLPVDQIVSALDALSDGLGETNWERCARAIMTTDTVPKLAGAAVSTSQCDYQVGGLAKGAGMICPNMATMLAFVATDAALSQQDVDQWLPELVATSFNSISVDGDTSTNDTVLLAAVGPTGPRLSATDKAAVKSALSEVFQALASAIVCDGEGATKVVTVEVVSARDDSEAERVARTIAHSPLVKTAMYASDPNWGRIVAAVGNAGFTDLDPTGLRVSINDVLIVDGGLPASSYTEAAGVAAMQPREITVLVELSRGQSRRRILTTDLSHEYVRINAEYRT